MHPPMPRLLTSLAYALAASLGLAAPSARAQTGKATAREPITLDLGGDLGGHIRLGDAPLFPVVDRGGIAYGVGAAIAPTTGFSIGLAIEHADLGREASPL